MVQRGVKGLVPLLEYKSSYLSKWEACRATLVGESRGVAPIEGGAMNAAGSSQECNLKVDPFDEEE